jgi:predicted TIM-barrel fold metal-dependent hydrolase
MEALEGTEMATALAELMGRAPLDSDDVEKVLGGVRGRIIDIDQHEMVPVHRWADVFGEVVRPISDLFEKSFYAEGPNNLNAHVDRDETAPSPDGWQQGPSAPSAIDMNRRLEVMDYYGVDRTLVFPTAIGLTGMVLSLPSPSEVAEFTNVPELIAMAAMGADYGHNVCRAHNDWCLDVAKLSSRLRPVAVVPTSSLDFALAEIRRVIAGGVRAVLLSTAIPPGGKSPGHPDIDPLWDTLAQANVPAMLHIGAHIGFLKSPVWGVHPDLVRPPDAIEIESPVNPYALATARFSSENYLTAMIYGGAFERHPNLRVGVQEFAAHWVAPLAQSLNQWAEIFATRLKKLSLTPTEYLQRNVRVSPFGWEDAGRYLSDPALEDVYCFGSDYPHFEGGKDPIGRLASKFVDLEPVLAEKFFVTNAEVLLPE